MKIIITTTTINENIFLSHTIYSQFSKYYLNQVNLFIQFILLIQHFSYLLNHKKL